jgi:opacity protein-like surface antigen
MRSLIVGVALGCLSIGQAQAMDWTGFYLGIEAGQNWHNTFSHITRENRPAENWSVSLTGGYMWDAGSALLGVEGEIGAINDGISSIPAGVLSYHYTRALASLSARAALPYDRFMPYASAGLQLTAVDVAVTYTNPALNGTIKGVGVLPKTSIGVEFSVTPEISVKAEYSATFGSVFLQQDNGASSDFYPQSALNIGLNYRF